MFDKVVAFFRRLFTPVVGTGENVYDATPSVEPNPNIEPYYVPYSIVKSLILDYTEARRVFNEASTEEERNAARETTYATLARYRELIGWNEEHDEDYFRILNGYISPRTDSTLRFIALCLRRV